MIPSAMLPPLPRAQWTLDPLSAPQLLEHMEVLKELYMPPIHGGFTAGDVEVETEDEATGTNRTNRINRSNGVKKRTLSGGSVDLPGLGLQMEGLGLENVAEEAFDDTEGEAEDEEEHNDPFERDWAEKWLSGVVRRAQTWLESEGEGEDKVAIAGYEAILREATAVLALMAGTSAAGGLTRHLLFPIAAELVPALRALRPFPQANCPSLSPQTTTFLQSLATSPVSPLTTMSSLTRKRGDSITSNGGKKQRLAALPVLLHDAPISDHLSVGVQTWGSAILLGREMALYPSQFGLFVDNLPHGNGTRVLELGAGTGLLSILCRKLLDLESATLAIRDPSAPHKESVVVATDFHPDVIANLRVCVDLNAPPPLPNTPSGPGIEIAKLDWTTFPQFMEARAGWSDEHVEEEELAPWVDTPFDLVLVSDCVYDPSHAELIRAVAAWVLRPPSATDEGGTIHLLSPIRPTFTPELESIDATFPLLSSYLPLSERAAAARPERPSGPVELRGEGLGAPTGHKLGARGAGKKSVKHSKGVGRSDEYGGYWWWEIGWG